jgi:hypothetical protein
MNGSQTIVKQAQLFVAAQANFMALLEFPKRAER